MQTTTTEETAARRAARRATDAARDACGCLTMQGECVRCFFARIDAARRVALRFASVFPD